MTRVSEIDAKVSCRPSVAMLAELCMSGNAFHVQREIEGFFAGSDGTADIAAAEPGLRRIKYGDRGTDRSS